MAINGDMIWTSMAPIFGGPSPIPIEPPNVGPVDCSISVGGTDGTLFQDTTSNPWEETCKMFRD